MTDKAGSDGAAIWLSQRLDGIERRMAEHNAAMRADMNVGFGEMRRVFSEHDRDDQLVEKRVTIIETERGIEKQIASRHGAIAGTIAAGLVLGLVESFKKLIGHN